jgi:hypothetical protein
MGRAATKLLLFCLLFQPGLLLSAGNLAESSPSRAADSQDIAKIQDYTRTLSKEWLKEYFALDLDALSWRMQRRAQEWINPRSGASLAPGSIGVRGDPGAAAGEAAAPVLYSMDLRIEQYDDLKRLQADVRDIPFAVKFSAEGSLFDQKLRMKTNVFLPLSWKDELRVEASVPLEAPAVPIFGGLLESAGFSQNWDLKSTYSNRLGVSALQTGIGTQWLGLWTLDYEFRMRFGQEVGDNSQWLRLGRTF